MKIAVLAFLIGCLPMQVLTQTNETSMKKETEKTEQQWAEELSDEKYQILRQCGTETPFTGK